MWSTLAQPPSPPRPSELLELLPDLELLGGVDLVVPGGGQHPLLRGGRGGVPGSPPVCQLMRPGGDLRPGPGPLLVLSHLRLRPPEPGFEGGHLSRELSDGSKCFFRSSLQFIQLPLISTGGSGSGGAGGGASQGDATVEDAPAAADPNTSTNQEDAPAYACQHLDSPQVASTSRLQLRGDL